MNTNVLTTAAALSDHDLLARLTTLAGREREASVELVAHLAALDARSSVYLAQGYGSLHAYCTQALRLSEDAASSRIAAARACRRFPVILDLLASGKMTLTSVRLLARHLTPENHQAVLARAKGQTLRQIERLVAALAPQPDARSLVRKLPTPTAPGPTPMAQVVAAVPAEPVSMTATPRSPRPVVRPTAAERYRVQFTLGEATHEKLPKLQALLRRDIPNGDPGTIFDRAVTLLLAHVESKKLGITVRPRSRPPIRRETDNEDIRTPPPLSRDIPRWVRRAVWKRDGGRCAFVSSGGAEVYGDEFPGVPPRPGVRDATTGHGGEHLPALPAPQSIRSRTRLRASSPIGPRRQSSANDDVSLPPRDRDDRTHPP